MYLIENKLVITQITKDINYFRRIRADLGHLTEPLEVEELDVKLLIAFLQQHDYIVVNKNRIIILNE